MITITIFLSSQQKKKDNHQRRVQPIIYNLSSCSVLECQTQLIKGTNEKKNNQILVFVLLNLILLFKK
jgi:hypothetical protein